MYQVRVVQTFLVLLFACQAIKCEHFGYSESNQRRWSRRHNHCAGKRQSPISIASSRTIPLHMPAVDLIGYHNLLPYPLVMKNNGHTVSIAIPKVNASSSSGFMPYVRGAKLPGEYEVEGVHFHWGDKNNRGAEHVINDIRYTMEMHIVHRNKIYADISEALQHTDGVAVLGFFFNLDGDEGTELLTICRHLHLIPDADNAVALNITFSLASLFSSVNTDKFFTYKGSLTTPPCSEAVTWILYPDPIPISAKQIARFRQLQDTQLDALVDNYRHLQPVGNRRVFSRVGHVHYTAISTLDNEVDSDKWDWFY